MKPLTKENLQEFIDNYPTDYSNHYRDRCYVDGIKDVLADLEATFLWENSDKVVEYLYSKGEFN